MILDLRASECCGGAELSAVAREVASTRDQLAVRAQVRRGR